MQLRAITILGEVGSRRHQQERFDKDVLITAC